LKYITVTEQQSLAFADTESPSINADQCLIKVHAIGINRADILQRQGKYPPPAGESLILGLEVSGEIIACGANVTKWLVGDKVFGLVAGGGYAQYVMINSEHLMALPQNLSFVQGAGIAEVFLTAYQSLFSLAKLQKQQTVLIHAGASGVGSAVIQLAKAWQCRVVVTVGSDEKGEACLKLGADDYINYKQNDFVAYLKKHYAQGFKVIVDVVAGSYLQKNINVAALDANIIILSMLGGRFSENIDIAKLLIKRITIQASTLRNRSDEYKRVLINDFMQTFASALITGDIKPVISQVFNWSEVEAAHHQMLNNSNIGKIILTVDHHH
jgi:putative PIG3 family NAD(P)H quinone oxidoreductase